MNIVGTTSMGRADLASHLAAIAAEHGVPADDIVVAELTELDDHVEVVALPAATMQRRTVRHLATIVLPDVAIGDWIVRAWLSDNAPVGDSGRVQSLSPVALTWDSDPGGCHPCGLVKPESRFHEAAGWWIVGRDAIELSVAEGDCMREHTGRSAAVVEAGLALARAGLEVCRLLAVAPDQTDEFAVEDVLASCVAAIRRGGWTPNVSAGPVAPATADLVIASMRLGLPTSTPDPIDRQAATDIATWIATAWDETTRSRDLIVELLDRGWVPQDRVELVAMAVAEHYLRRTRAEPPAAVPVGNGLEFEGTVVLYGLQDRHPYPDARPVMTVQGDDGWHVVGTIPASIRNDIRIGARVRFTANTAPTADPTRSGFRRPRSATIIADHPDTTDPAHTPSPDVLLNTMPHRRPRRPRQDPIRSRPATTAQINYIRGLLDDLAWGDGVDTTTVGVWAQHLVEASMRGRPLSDLGIADAGSIIDVLKMVRELIARMHLDAQHLPNEVMNDLLDAVTSPGHRDPWWAGVDVLRRHTGDNPRR